jgi:hypothetical protein
MNIVFVWLVRMILIPLGLRIWWITRSIRAIPIRDMSWIYFFLYCVVTVVLICYLLITVEVYLLPDREPNSPQIFGAGLLICVPLLVLFPLVVITHWLFCSKRTWYQSIILPAYVLLLAGLWFVRSYSEIIAMLFSLKNLVMVAAILHIYPSFMAANLWGILSSVLMVLAMLIGSAASGEASKITILAYLSTALSAASLMAMSFTMMILDKPTLESDTTSYFNYFMSSVGAGKYVGDVEYHCYGTTDFYGFQIRA